MQKDHSKDYLKEYISDKSDWFANLVNLVIEKNGKITQEDKDLIFEELLRHEGLVEVKQEDAIDKDTGKPNKNNEVVPESLYLSAITHYNGVNALMKNQPIKFSESCTVLYGLNGSGKSGYFRILNELSGATKQKIILNNIYHDDDEEVEVKIDHSLNGEAHSICWNNENREVYPFNLMKVFDAECLPIYLNERKSAVNIEPLGLHLFKVITNTLDELKERLKIKKRALENQKPYLYPLIQTINATDISSILEGEVLTSKEKTKLEKYKKFSTKNSVYLQKLKTTIHS